MDGDVKRDTENDLDDTQQKLLSQLTSVSDGVN